MKLILTLTLLLSADLYSAAKFNRGKHINILGKTKNITVRVSYTTQFLDHFNPTEARTWEQKYFVNEEYYDNGPIFILLSGQNAADPLVLFDGYINYLCEKFKAMCFLLEHRFYGTNHPLPDLSQKNLIYLNADQALADIAYFILELQSVLLYPPDSQKFIIFGEGYAGTLAAWSHLKYPHLVHGAVVDSAPLFARANFPEYYAAVENLFNKHSTACTDLMKSALEKVYTSLFSAEGQKNLTKTFNFCHPINITEPTANDISSLYIEFLNLISEIALNPIKGQNISQTCEIMLNHRKNLPVEVKLSIVLELLLEAKNETCLHLWNYSDRVENLREITVKENEIYRQYEYQACNEFGWFVDTSERPFNLSVDVLPKTYFENLCNDVFGNNFFRYPRKLNREIKRTNLVYGGKNIGDITSDIIFIYGSDDPWNTFGVLNSDNPDIFVINVKDVSYPPLKYPPSKNDLPQILDAKKKVENIVGKWITQK